MSKQFIFVNAQGDYEESVNAFEVADFIDTSAGVADAGKPVILDAGGRIDASMIDDSDIDHDLIANTHNLTTDIDHDQLTNFDVNEHFTVASIDHGSIAGLGDDDHTIYSLVDGSRDYSAVVSYDSAKTFTSDAEIVDKRYVDQAIASSGTSSEWQDSCADILLTPPGSAPATGTRYLINGVGTGAFAGQDYDIAEYNGATYDFTTPTTGTFVSVDDETDGIYYFGGTGPWVKKEFEALSASLGCEIVASDIRLDMLAGGGLKLTGNEVGVEPNDFAGAGLVDDGSDNLAVDFSTTFNDAKAVKAEDLNSVVNGEGASIIGIEDAGAYTSETTVEGALQELYGEIAGGIGGVEYTVGAGGVTKGDLVYISANNTVLPYTTITTAQAVIGVADATVTAGSTVKVLANDSVLAGVVVGATAGTKYFWDGANGWVTGVGGFGSGEYIWMGGVAKNATDVQVEVMFIKKTS